MGGALTLRTTRAADRSSPSPFPCGNARLRNAPVRSRRRRERPGGSARAHHRQFAVRGAGHRCAPDRGRRQGGPGRRARTGLAALSDPQRPDLVIVDCALGPEATIRLAQAARAAGGPRSLRFVLAVRAPRLRADVAWGFDGWLVKPVRARSLFERLAAEFRNAPDAPRLEPPPARARRALIAEDNDINALIAEKALRRLGFDVVRASDGEEALRLAAPAAPPLAFDLILMDLKMPGLDGRGDPPPAPARGGERVADAHRRAHRQRPGRKPAPSVAAGFDAFLVKPFDFRELATTVERVCAAGSAPRRERLRA